MSRNTRRFLWVATLVTITIAVSGCEISLPLADCSSINQPDMGGLVCLGLNVLTAAASVVGIIAALLVALGSGLPA